MERLKALPLFEDVVGGDGERAGQHRGSERHARCGLVPGDAEHCHPDGAEAGDDGEQKRKGDAFVRS